MTMLGTAVDADDPVITTDTPLTITGNYPARYTLDDEAVYVIGGSGTTSLSVLRGQDNTAKASHAVNTTLMSAPVGASGVQRVRLLGPFHVAHDTPAGAGTFADGEYLEIFALPDGCFVLAAWAEATEAWAGSGANIGFDIMPQGDDGSNSSDISASSVVGSGPDTTAPATFALSGIGSISTIQYARAIADAALAAVYHDQGVPTSTGEADIYALIAEPA